MQASVMNSEFRDGRATQQRRTHVLTAVLVSLGVLMLVSMVVVKTAGAPLASAVSKVLRGSASAKDPMVQFQPGLSASLASQSRGASQSRSPLQSAVAQPFAMPLRNRGMAPLLKMGAATEVDAKKTQDELKKEVGYRAVDQHVKSGMVVGLGTGSTAYFAVERVGQLLKSGELKDILAIPTSVATKDQAESLNIPLVTLDTHQVLDVAIDGADTVDETTLDLVKGGGAAHLREKMVEVRAKKFIVIVDGSKIADGLGPHFKLPVEVTPFCYEATKDMVMQLPAFKGIIDDAASGMRKKDGELVKTDNNNYVLDLAFKSPISDPSAAAEQISRTVGVVEHGLFVGMTTEVLVADAEKGVYAMLPPKKAGEKATIVS